MRAAFANVMANKNILEQMILQNKPSTGRVCIVLLVERSETCLAWLCLAVLGHVGAGCCLFMNRRVWRARRPLAEAALAFYYVGLSSVEFCLHGLLVVVIIHVGRDLLGHSLRSDKFHRA